MGPTEPHPAPLHETCDTHVVIVAPHAAGGVDGEVAADEGGRAVAEGGAQVGFVVGLGA